MVPAVRWWIADVLLSGNHQQSVLSDMVSATAAQHDLPCSSEQASGIEQWSPPGLESFGWPLGKVELMRFGVIATDVPERRRFGVRTVQVS